MHAEKLHVQFAGGGKGVVLSSEHLGSVLYMQFSFLFSSILLSLSRVKITVVFLQTILPREITHLEPKRYHKVLGISDCYRCHVRTPVAKTEASKFGL